jgi:gamma-glutamylcyclotransferase
MDLYFAYGSNMSTTRLQARVEAALPVSHAFIDGWRLAFDKPGRDGTGKANLVEIAGERTWGVLFRVPPSAWAVLDEFEPGYQRCEFRFTRRTADELEAHAYVYSSHADVSSEATHGPPSHEYLEHLLTGAREHDLPRDHIALIESFRRLPGR